MESNTLTVHINRKTTILAIVSNSREILATMEVEEKVDSTTRLVNLIKEMSGRNPQLEYDFIGIALDATVDKLGHYVVESQYLKGLEDIDLYGVIKCHFDKPSIIINQTTALARYYIQENELKGKGITVTLEVSDSMNSSIYIEDRFLVGRNGHAGSIGHSPVLDKKHQCDCGKLGCMHLYTTMDYLEILNNIHSKGQPLEEAFDSFTVIDKISDGISVVIANIINMINPDNLILTGDVIHMDNFPIVLTLAKVDMSTLPSNFRTIETEPNDYAVALGLVQYVNEMRTTPYEI